MRKLSLVAIAVLAVAVLGLPAVFGHLTESQVDARVAEINDVSPLDVTIEDYARGWFTSTADLTIRLSPEYLSRLEAGGTQLPVWLSAETPLPVRAGLAHGPVGFDNGAFAGLSKVVAYADTETPWVRDLTEAYGMPYLFEFRGRTGFTGRASFDADVPGIEPGDSVEHRFSGAGIEGTLTGNHLVAELDIERLDVVRPGVSVRMNGVHATTDSRFRGNSQSTGMAALEVTELGLEALPAGPGAAPGAVEMSGVRLATEGTLEGGAWRTRLDYTAEAIESPNGQRVESPAIGVGVDNLDAAAIDEIRALLARGRAGPAARGPAIAPPELEAVLNQLLAAEPSLEIAPIRFTSDGDAFDANVRLAIREDAAPLSMAQLTGNPIAWIGLVDGSIDATVAKPLARRLAAGVARAQLEAQQDADPSRTPELAESQASIMLVMLSGQGYLEETEDAYSTQIRLTDGAVTINGEPMPLFGAP